MSEFLGIDTSNYTTSAAIADLSGVVQSEKQLLPVAQGERGLRQSDALFFHTRALPEIIERLGRRDICAVGYSARPRDGADSYMPCFLAGESAARSIASVLGVPAYPFSHQAGHIAAALYSCGHEELHGTRFLAFHVSGGTTDLISVSPDGQITRVGGTQDLNAGQLIDRVGVMLGLSFPAGPALERLMGDTPLPAARPCVRGLKCNLSGGENRAADMIRRGEEPCAVAAYTVALILNTLDRMTSAALEQLGKQPVVFAGGVMSNCTIRNYMQEKYGAYFAEPKYSSDNAAGTALLCRRRYLSEDGSHD